MTHNHTYLPEVSLSGHGVPGKWNTRRIDYAVKEWERGRTDNNERWQLCFWDGVERLPSAIRALIVVQ